MQPLSVFLQGLEVGVQRDTLQSGVRQYLHRMIICLGDELLKYVPMAVSLLLKDCKVGRAYLWVTYGSSVDTTVLWLLWAYWCAGVELLGGTYILHYGSLLGEGSYNYIVLMYTYIS